MNDPRGIGFGSIKLNERVVTGGLKELNLNPDFFDIWR